MVKKLDSELIGIIRELLGLKWSFSRIRNHLKKDGVLVSIGSISNIKNDKGKVKSSEDKENRGRRSSLSEKQSSKIRELGSDSNPLSQLTIAKKLNITKRMVNYHIHHTLGKKTVRKPKGHVITEAIAEKRRVRSLALYRRLKEGNWEKFITSDETLISLDESQGQTKIQYLDQDQSRNEAEIYTSSNF